MHPEFWQPLCLVDLSTNGIIYKMFHFVETSHPRIILSIGAIPHFSLAQSGRLAPEHGRSERPSTILTANNIHSPKPNSPMKQKFA